MSRMLRPAAAKEELPPLLPWQQVNKPDTGEQQSTSAVLLLQSEEGLLRGGAPNIIISANSVWLLDGRCALMFLRTGSIHFLGRLSVITRR